MKERDKKIDDNIAILEEKLNKLKEEHKKNKHVPITNLTLKTNSIGGNISFNLRMLSEQELYQVYYTHILSVVQAKQFITNDEIDYNTIIYGYKFSDWNADFKYQIKEIQYLEKSNSINKNINKLKSYYSEDKIIDQEIDDLLNI